MSFAGELRGIRKSYGECHANQAVDLSVRAGTIHALVGENGAGKSTAMKILFGLITSDEGAIRFGGEDVTADWNPHSAFRRGIGMVHQHFMLAGPESVHDNLVLGAETVRLGLRRRREERARLDELMKLTGLQVPLDAAVEKLPIGLQSRCEILKVLYRKASFLILDEPTAVLTPQETEDLLKSLRDLRDRGNTILIVTHKLKEVMAVADEVTVLRAGRTVATKKVAETSIPELSELMVGRRLQMPRVARDEGASRSPERASLSTAKLSLSLHTGEITGIAGVEGNGQDALIQAIASPAAAQDVKLRMLGSDASAYTTRDVRKMPIALIPADRHREGLVLPFTLTENLRLGRAQTAKRGYLPFGSANASEKDLLKTFDVRPNQPEAQARMLSGGNQQKLIVARELGGLRESEISNCVVLAVHPTRGVDIGAIEFIHGRLLDVARRGAAVLLVSSELDELMALSHRIGVMYKSQITRWFEGPPYDEYAIGLAMLGGHA